MQTQENAGRCENMRNGIGRVLYRCVFLFACSMCGDSVACVRHRLLLVGIGGKSGKRKRWQVGIFVFLFLNFFATQIWGFFQHLTRCSALLYALFLFLSALLLLFGSLYHLTMKKEQTAIKSENIFSGYFGDFI